MKDIWNLHLKQDSLDDFQDFLKNSNIWDLVAIDGYSLLHSAATNKLGRRADEKLDLVIAKWVKNHVSQSLVEIQMGRSPILMALDRN